MIVHCSYSTLGVARCSGRSGPDSRGGAKLVSCSTVGAVLLLLVFGTWIFVTRFVLN